MLLAWVRSLTGLAPFSVFANAANFIAMTVVIKDEYDVPHTSTDIHPFTGWGAMPFAIGVAVYCFEAFSITLSLEASMKDRRQFPMTLGLGFIFVATLYVVFGTCGYLAFGGNTQEIVTLNLPNDWTTIAIKAGLCTGLMFTIPVVMQPVHNVAEGRLGSSKWFQKHIGTERPELWQNIAFKSVRFAIIALLVVLSTKVPGFTTLCSILGATVCALLAFVLPATLHMHIFWVDLNRAAFVFDVFLVIGGILFACYGTYGAVTGMY